MKTATATTLVSLTAACLALPAGACPPIPHQDRDAMGARVQTELSWGVVRYGTSPVRGPEASQNPAVVGEWQTPMGWEVIAIHAAVLPTGEVLHYSYPGDLGSRARVWDPATGNFSDVDIDIDLFCSGLIHLADGTIYVTGGNTDGCEFRGRPVTHIFNPFDLQWTQLEDMFDGRWYPTNVILPDGRVLIFSGLDRLCELNPEVEMYDPGKGLEFLTYGTRAIELYPRMHVLSDGLVAHVGPERRIATFEVGHGWENLGWSLHGYRSQGTSVLLPFRTDEVMIIGGSSGGAATNTCEIIDFKEDPVDPRYTDSLAHARAHADALILADGTIMCVGGGLTELYGDPVNIPELFDPVTETWTELTPHVYGRMYHATTLLLPDGRVLVAGQDNGDSAFIGEMYQPPYLFRGARPVLNNAPDALRYARGFDIDTPDASDIGAVHLIRLSTVTHSVNFEQRLIPLGFEVTDADTLRVQAPADAFAGPPGHYMLFVLNDEGVPAIAPIVQVTPWRQGDANNDGTIDFGDILLVLGQWGPCSMPPADCAGDMNGDMTVDFGDLLAVLAGWG